MIHEIILLNHKAVRPHHTQHETFSFYSIPHVHDIVILIIDFNLPTYLIALLLCIFTDICLRLVEMYDSKVDRTGLKDGY